MKLDRRAFVASLGGPAAISLMTPDDKADALEHYMEDNLKEADVLEGILKEVRRLVNSRHEMRTLIGHTGTVRAPSSCRETTVTAK